jgi:ornithine cyclodeaminase/alanine dehydrogenase-like protein (mu-crystallin family)
MNLTDLPLIDEVQLRQRVSPRAAVDALEAALRDGTAPGLTPPRGVLEVPAGQLLLMPSASARFVGVKLASVGTGNVELGLPRIQGVYVLFDAATLSPVALMDGVALTALRTPAVSALALRHLMPAGSGSELHVMCIGTGPQGYGHLEAVAAETGLSRVSVVGRDAGRAQSMAQWCRDLGWAVDVVAADAADAVRAAMQTSDVVITATTARQPVVHADWLAPEAVVLAVGSHEPTAREVDTATVLAATVVVETRDGALREAGDVVIPIAEGACGPEVMAADLAELVGGAAALPAGRPRLFKSCGQAWQDLVVAAAALQ